MASMALVIARKIVIGRSSRLGEPPTRLDRADALAPAADVAQGGAPGDEQVGDHGQEVRRLRGREHRVARGDRLREAALEVVGPRASCARSAIHSGVVGEIAELGDGRLEDGSARSGLRAGKDMRTSSVVARHAALPVVLSAVRSDRILEQGPRPMQLARSAAPRDRPARGAPPAQPRRPSRLERLLEERERLGVRRERGRAVGGGAERRSAPGPRARRPRARRRVGVRGEVVAGERARELVRPERLEVARGREVARTAGRAARACCTRPRGSGPGRTRTGRARASGGRRRRASSSRRTRLREAALERRPRRRPTTAGEGRRPRSSGPARPRPGRARDPAGSRASSRAAMSARERVGDRERARSPSGAIGAVPAARGALGEQHPDGLDRVQRDAVRAGDDRRDGPVRQPGHQAREELAHRAPAQRLEEQAGEAAAGRRPSPASPPAAPAARG